jgi:hypothetical protein
MNTLRITVAVFLLSIAVTTMAAPASENSIKQIIVVTNAQKNFDNLKAQINTFMNNLEQQALKGKTPTVKQQQAITKMKKRMIAIVQRELAWEKMEPIIIRLYKETFTEDEVIGMLSFYQTKAGQAVINKIPALMQKQMQQMQRMIVEMTPEMNKIEKDFADEIKAASKQLNN